LAQSEAQLAVTEANQVRTQLDVDRYTPPADYRNNLINCFYN